MSITPISNPSINNSPYLSNDYNYGQYGPSTPPGNPDAPLLGPMDTGNENTMNWYNQTLGAGRPDASQPLNQQQSDPSNFGFNANNKSAELNKQALGELQGMASKLDTADNPFLNPDNTFGKNDMEAALNDTNGRFSDKEKAVIQYILNTQMNNDPKSTLWNAIERDGIVTPDAIKTALSRDLAPDASTMHDDGLVA
jgi:hypothetical protein